MAGNFTVNKHDLEFILKQIQVAELHASTPGMTLVQAIAQIYGLSELDAALSPFGLRTVDGSLNNLLPGQSEFGATNTEFPRLLDPVYTEGSGGEFDANGPAPGGVVTNADYTPTLDGANMNVVDSDPRTISNLIVDQSVANPAAVYAALKVAGIEGDAATAAVEAISAAYRATLNANGASAAVTQALAALTTANGELAAATVAAAATQAAEDAYAAADALTGAAATAVGSAQTAVDALAAYLDQTAFISVADANAAAAATQAVVDAYAAAGALATSAGTAAAAAQTSAGALAALLNTPDFLPEDAQAAFAAAVADAAAALAAAQAVVTALAGNPSTAADATVAEAQALVDALALLDDDGLDDADAAAAQAAADLAASLVALAAGGASDIASSLSAAEAADAAADANLAAANGQQAAAQGLFDAAAAAATGALTAAQAVVIALDGNPSTAAAAVVTGAQALIDALAPLDDNGFDASDRTPALDAATAFQSVSGPGGEAEDSATGIAASLAAALVADDAADALLATETAEQGAAQAAYDAAVAAAGTAGTPEQTAAALAALLDGYGLETDAEGGLVIETRSPDVGLSPSFNNVMTIFGQFFDHGLDLVNKGGNGTVYIPLTPDDPLIAGADKVFGTADDLPEHLRFMTLTRATQTIDENGQAQHTNATTSFVDQNQTYTSHASHQVFLREYVRIDGETLSTGKLLDGETDGVPDGTIGTWADVKANALEFLGIALTDHDVGRVPLLLTDAYGNLILGANGYAQMVMAPDAEHPANWLKEGTAEGISTAGSLEAGVAFLVDIANTAEPGALPEDADEFAGNAIARNPITGQRLEYDDELLDAHFVTGDGRGNENIGLTAIHGAFHAEHNRVVDANKATILATGDRAFINEWLLVDLNEAEPIPTDVNAVTWDGARMFQAARFSTEMQYQHLVFEEFARRIQPAVDPFVFTNTADIDPSILAEFAHTVYRFGHSMLTESVDRLDNDLNLVNGDAEQMSLIEAFLNPIAYNETGADFDEIQGALFRGMARDVGSEIDEFIVPALRSNLLGLPLDLAALNIARGRDTGVPSLNETRAQLYNDFGLADLEPYSSWNDFAQHLRNPVSVINFIAAYGTHAAILGATTLEEKRDAATLLVFGDGSNADGVTIAGFTYTNADRLAFLNGTGAYDANGARGGLDDVDFWIGGLAEVRPEFGGMLGTTFNFIFEYQMEALQNGDRLYYLSRTQGLNLLDQLEQNTFSDIVARNSDLSDPYATHMSAQLFITPDIFLELDRQIAQTDYAPDDPDSRDPTFEGVQELLTPKVVRDYSTTTTDENGHDVGGVLHFLGGEHIVLGGTEGDDTLTSDIGDDAIYGDGGDDYINAGTGADQVFGGAGDDIIEDPFGDDFLRGGEGNDVVSAARGLDVLFGGEGHDVIIMGQDAAEAFAGEGDDYVLGGSGVDVIGGNEGDDWLEGGEGFDGIAGDNSELFFNSTIIGHDVAWGQGNDQDYDMESGDDITFTGVGIQRSEGMYGFDWGITKYDVSTGPVDLGLTAANNEIGNILRDRFDLVEALSGWDRDDDLRGDDRAADVEGELDFANHVLTGEGIDRIDGMRDWIAGALATLGTPDQFRDGNILLGGGGSDVITGRGGNDIIDGDAWLNVRIRVMVDGVEYSAESLTTNQAVAGPHAGKLYHVDANGDPDFTSVAFNGRSLTSLLLNRTVNPGDMSIVREIKLEDGSGDTDRAVFAGTSDQYVIEGRGEVVDGFVQVAHDMNGDGFISVSEADARLVDDTDLIRNIEELQFADVTLRLADVVAAVPVTTEIAFIANQPVGADLPAVGAELGRFAPDGQNVTLSLLAGGSTSFALDGATGALTVASALVQNVTHSVTVVATNSGGSLSEAFSLRIGSAAANAYAGTAGTDIVYGLGGADALNGGEGDDVLFGQAGNDALNGGDDDDLLTGGLGADAVDGGNGDDRIVWLAGHGRDTSIAGGAGADQLEIVGDAANNVLRVTFDGAAITNIAEVGAISGIETITADLAGGLDQISYRTTTVTGISVDLRTGAATGFASIANVSNIEGTNFADSMVGDGGANQMLGLGGDDLFIATVDDERDEYNGGANVDTVDYSAYAAGLTINLATVEPIEVAGSGAVTDILRGVENLIGGSGDDAFTGGAATNIFTGGLGADQLNGGGGNDVLNGGDGADVLFGGTGIDLLTGGAGDDRFAFSAVNQSAPVGTTDTISDFDGAGVAGGDVIDLRGAAANLLFIGAGTFAAGATNQVRFSHVGGDTLIQIDNDASTDVDSQIRLTGIHNLTANDFQL